MNAEKNLKALSHAQLVQLINDVFKISPGIKEVSIVGLAFHIFYVGISEV